MIANGDAQAERWCSMARPLYGYAVVLHEFAQSNYLAGDHRGALECGQAAITCIATADQAVRDLQAQDPAWATCCEHMHEYATLYTYGVESLLADMRRKRRLRPDRAMSKAEARDVSRMHELRDLACVAARAIVEEAEGDPDIIAPWTVLYAECKAEPDTAFNAMTKDEIDLALRPKRET